MPNAADDALARATRYALREAGARVKRVTAAIATLGYDTDLATQLQEETARRDAARAVLTAAGAERGKVVLHPAAIRKYVTNLLKGSTPTASRDGWCW